MDQITSEVRENLFLLEGAGPFLLLLLALRKMLRAALWKVYN